MDHETLAAELRALAATPSSAAGSKTARLRALLPEVEAALGAGHTQAEVLDKLRAHGLVMSLPVFNKTLHRLRAKAGTPKRAAKAAATAPPARPVASAAPAFRDPAEPEDMDDLIKHGKGNKA